MILNLLGDISARSYNLISFPLAPESSAGMLQKMKQLHQYHLVHFKIDIHTQKIKIKKKTKTPRITDEGWNSQKRLSDPVEKKMKEGKRRRKRLQDLYLHPKLSSGLVPYRLFYRIGI